MGVKRKLICGLKPPSKHKYSLRSKSKFNQFEMENFCLRFPSLSSEIFGELDYQTLVKCIELNQFWRDHIIEERIYLIRKLQQCSEEFTEFTMEWKKVLKKTPMHFLEKLEVATRALKGNHTKHMQERQGWQGPQGLGLD